MLEIEAQEEQTVRAAAAVGLVPLASLGHLPAMVATLIYKALLMVTHWVGVVAEVRQAVPQMALMLNTAAVVGLADITQAMAVTKTAAVLYSVQAEVLARVVITVAQGERAVFGLAIPQVVLVMRQVALEPMEPLGRHALMGVATVAVLAVATGQEQAAQARLVVRQVEEEEPEVQAPGQVQGLAAQEP